MLSGNPTGIGAAPALAVIDDKVDAIQADVGNASGRTNDDSLEEMIGIPDTAGKDFYTILVTDRLDHAVKGLTNIQAQTDATLALVNARIAGRTQIATKDITAAANAGTTNVMTATTKDILVKSVTIHANDAQTGDMTSCALVGGASDVIDFIAVGVAIQASLDAEDKQVSSGLVGIFLPVGKGLNIDLQGTGATAVDLTVIVEYEAVEDGGYLLPV